MAENRARQVEGDEAKIEADGLSKRLTAMAADKTLGNATYGNKTGEDAVVMSIADDRKQSVGARMAAVSRMINNNDYDGLSRVMKNMEANGEGALIDRIKGEHGGTLVQKAPQLVKTGPGQASNPVSAASGLSDSAVAGMHTSGLKNLINETAQKYHSATDPGDKAKAKAALENILTQYSAAVANENISVGPGTVDVMNSFEDAVTGGAAPAPNAKNVAGTTVIENQVDIDMHNNLQGIF